MSEMKIKLRDLRRAIEDYRKWKTDLEYCNYKSWDGKVRCFKQFLDTTPVVGEQIKSLAALTTADIEQSILDGIFPHVQYSPPADVNVRLSLLARLLLTASANSLSNLGMRIVNAGGGHDVFLGYIRTEMLAEFFQTVESRLDRKLEDLQDQYHEDSDLIPFSQTFIFGTHIGIAAPGGQVTFNIGAANELGAALLIRNLETLQKKVAEIAEEQTRAAVAAEATDLTASRKLDEILRLVRENKAGPAAEKWKEFIGDYSVSGLAGAAGNVVDVVTLTMWLFVMSQGQTPNVG